jgi:very-short-patch-repair endonuclease
LNETTIKEFEREGHWKIMRIRNDKIDPNALRTANSVLESIEQPVEENVVINCT